MMDYNGFCQNFLKSWLRSFCFRESLANDFDDTVDADESVFEDEVGQKKKKKMKEMEIEDKDISDIEDDLGLELSVTENSDLLARPPKIWISKTASMEHDLD